MADTSDADLTTLVQAEFNRMKERSLQHFIRRIIRERILQEIDDVMKAHKEDIRSIVEAEVLTTCAAMAKPQ